MKKQEAYLLINDQKRNPYAKPYTFFGGTLQQLKIWKEFLQCSQIMKISLKPGNINIIKKRGYKFIFPHELSQYKELQHFAKDNLNTPIIEIKLKEFRKLTKV